ncbi:class I SAM-dependent methyltransferase [Candidatus Micrarchaeota archaeon]|nr:class I SAM-dependent methyltransferase [Candidatus Micrarchaeota archaeon]
MPSIDEIRKKERAKYNQDYFEAVYWEEDFSNKPHHRKLKYNDPTHEKRFSFITNLLIKHFAFKTFLDAGCGTGQLLRKLLKKGIDCKGCDVSEYAIRHYLPELKEQGIATLAGLEKLPFKTNAFDLVFCSDVMEHIPMIDVKASIKELTRVTNQYLVLTINLDNPYEYHPTILTRKSWEKLFLQSNQLKQIKNMQNTIEKETKQKYKEYDFFVFEKQ